MVEWKTRDKWKKYGKQKHTKTELEGGQGKMLGKKRIKTEKDLEKGQNLYVSKGY